MRLHVLVVPLLLLPLPPFRKPQRNLMELLSEQKRELDIVREKGVQLETAAATSAAAAAATAQRARDHEAKAAAMYGQTEELMKFQFMSMSLSYFSSLNMMKQVRWGCFGRNPLSVFDCIVQDEAWPELMRLSTGSCSRNGV